MPEIPFKTYKTVLGKVRIKYQCPRCQEVLESEIDEAGTADICPGCKASFTVPGEAALRQHRKKPAPVELPPKQSEAIGHSVTSRRMAEELASINSAVDTEADRLRTEQINQISQTRQPALWCNTPCNYKYPTLRQYCASLRFVGYFVLVTPLIVLATGLSIAAVMRDVEITQNTVVGSLLLILPCIGIAMTFFIAAQSIQLMLELREDVAKLVTQNSRK